MRIDLVKLVKISLLIMFLSLAPIALLSQDDSKDKVKGVDTPDSLNSSERKDGRINWRYHIQNREFSELKQLLDAYIVEYLGEISKKPKYNTYIHYPEQNAIVFIIEKQYVPYVRKFMNKIDAPRKQVLLNVMVESITYENETQVGWELSHNIELRTGNSNLYYRGFEFSFHPDDFISALTENAPGTGAKYWAAQDDFLGTTIFFNSAGESQNRLGGLSGAYRLLAKTEKVRIVAQPYVTVEPGYEAVFQTGEEVPVSTIKTVGTSTVVSTTFETVGIKLKMKPISIGSDYVRMYVYPEVSAVSRYFDPGDQFVSNPIIIRRYASTIVTIKSGGTLLIGGLKSDKTLISTTGVPILSELPLVGYLFSANRKEVKRQDIVFTITPTILMPGEIPTPDKSKLSSSDITITK